MAEQHLSFIHAADLHLDSPFKGLAGLPEHVLKEVQESTFKALETMVDAAVARDVDFVLISGDLFDNDHQTLKAQVRLRDAFETLGKYRIEVYMLYGNHDHTSGNKYPVDYPDNVHVFPDEDIRQFVFRKSNQVLAAIYGFSYEHRSVSENKAVLYEKKDATIPYHIGMLHGSLGSNTEHDVYAPFQISDLLNTGMEYWALGHIHQREILKADPPIVYPGNTQGRSRKENGEKGCYYVEMSPAGSTLSFLPTQAVTFRKVVIDAGGCEDLFQLEQAIQSELKTIDSVTHQLIYVTIESTAGQLEAWDQNGRLMECIELINETVSNQVPWQFIYQYHINSHVVYNDLYKGAHFAGEALRQLEHISVQEQIADLYSHRRARKYLDPIDAETEKALKEKTRQWLVQEFMSGGRL